jgi:hypothetical protein
VAAREEAPWVQIGELGNARVHAGGPHIRYV